MIRHRRRGCTRRSWRSPTCSSRWTGRSRCWASVSRRRPCSRCLSSLLPLLPPPSGPRLLFSTFPSLPLALLLLLLLFLFVRLRLFVHVDVFRGTLPPSCASSAAPR